MPFDPDVETFARLRSATSEEARSALRTLFDTHYDMMYRVAARVVGVDTADDVVQDTLLRLWTMRASLAVTTSVRAYLARATRNQALNAASHDRAGMRAADRAGVYGTVPSASARDERVSAQRLVESAELDTRIRHALSTLPPRQREAMLLRWHDELTVPEIGDALGITERGARKLLAAATDTLRPLFADDRAS